MGSLKLFGIQQSVIIEQRSLVIQDEKIDGSKSTKFTSFVRCARKTEFGLNLLLLPDYLLSHIEKVLQLIFVGNLFLYYSIAMTFFNAFISVVLELQMCF